MVGLRLEYDTGTTGVGLGLEWSGGHGGDPSPSAGIEVQRDAHDGYHDRDRDE